jgi:hypothetical protein
MAKRRTFQIGRSDILYKWKMLRLYQGTAPEDIVREVVNGMANRWTSRFGLYNAYWELFKEQGNLANLAPADHAKVKALLNYVIALFRKYGTLEGLDAQIRFVGTKKLGLSDATVDEVITFVSGLVAKATQRA